MPGTAPSLFPPVAAAGRDLPTLRRLFLIAGAVYLVWWFVVQALVPGAFNPFPSRLLVVSLFFASLGATYLSAWARRHAEHLFAAGAWLLTLHYYWLLHRNLGDMPWAVGAYVVVVAVGACLDSRSALASYSIYSVVLAGVVSALHPALLHSIFLAGLLTMVILSNVTGRMRLLLEEERATRTRSEVAREAAEAAVALRDEFISIASHELNTPLAALKLSVQALKRGLRNEEDPVRRQATERYTDKCERQVDRLSRLVGELLSAARISVGNLPLHTEEVVLADLVREVSLALSDEATRAGSPIEVTGDGSVRGTWDRVRVEQVVTNLLRNALIFGLGKPIQVVVSAAPGGARARLTVRDEGIGIAPAEQARVFKRFERAVSSRNHGGMGLGLYIVQQIAEAHGGLVTVESTPGAGATFTFELPIRPGATGGPGPAA